VFLMAVGPVLVRKTDVNAQPATSQGVTHRPASGAPVPEREYRCAGSAMAPDGTASRTSRWTVWIADVTEKMQKKSERQWRSQRASGHDGRSHCVRSGVYPIATGRLQHQRAKTADTGKVKGNIRDNLLYRTGPRTRDAIYHRGCTGWKPACVTDGGCEVRSSPGRSRGSEGYAFRRMPRAAYTA